MLTFPNSFWGTQGAPIFLGQVGLFGSGSGQNCVLSTIADAPAGSTIVVFMSPTNAITTTTMGAVTDSAGNSYTTDQAHTGDGHQGLYMVRCENCNHLPAGSLIQSMATFTGGSNQTWTDLVAFAIPPAQVGPAPLDVVTFNLSGSNQTSSTTLSSGVLAQASEYLMTVLGLGNSGPLVGSNVSLLFTGWDRLSFLSNPRMGSNNNSGTIVVYGQRVRSTASVSFAASFPSNWWAQGMYSFKLR